MLRRRLGVASGTDQRIRVLSRYGGEICRCLRQALEEKDFKKFL